MKKIQYVLLFAISLLVILALLYIVLLIRSDRTHTTSSSITTTISPTPLDTPAPRVSSIQSKSPLDEPFIEEYTKTEARVRPDLTINNNAPYENTFFRVTTEFVSADPGYFKIIVAIKNGDDKTSKQAFADWIKSLDISDEATKQLRIEFVPDL